MEGSSASSFGIDTILSSAGSCSSALAMMEGDFRAADFRSRATPSPCSDVDAGARSPSSPISVTAEPPEPHPVQDGLHHHLHHHHYHPVAQNPAACAPRTATSSFLIKDILGDGKPLAACAPYSASLAPSPQHQRQHHHTPKAESADCLTPKAEHDEHGGKAEKREDIHNDTKCNGKNNVLPTHACLGRKRLILVNEEYRFNETASTTDSVWK